MTNDSPDLPAGFRAEEWIYLGKYCAKNGKLLENWLTPTDVEKLMGTKVGYPVGGVFRMVTDGEKTYVGPGGTLGPLYLHPSEDPRLLEWTAAHRIQIAIHEAEQRRAREQRKGDLITEMLAPIREAYFKNITPQARAAFLAICIEEITRYKRKES